MSECSWTVGRTLGYCSRLAWRFGNSRPQHTHWTWNQNPTLLQSALYTAARVSMVLLHSNSPALLGLKAHVPAVVLTWSLSDLNCPHPIRYYSSLCVTSLWPSSVSRLGLRAHCPGFPNTPPTHLCGLLLLFLWVLAQVQFQGCLPRPPYLTSQLLPHTAAPLLVDCSLQFWSIWPTTFCLFFLT